MDKLQNRRRIRNASAFFYNPAKKNTPEAIEESIRVLREAKEWAENHNFIEDENSALWCLFLCYLRRASQEKEKQEDCYKTQAKQAWHDLRANLERWRGRIKDPFDRGGVFHQYPHLFSRMCQFLCQENLPSELLSVIEGKKARFLADKLSEEKQQAITYDTFIKLPYHLPSLMKGVGAHYLSYFVDDESTYAVLVTKDGSFHAQAIPIGRVQLQKLLEFDFDEENYNPVNPKNWGKNKNSNEKVGNLSASLASLVKWLEPLVKTGLLQKDDHLCYSPDQSLYLIPLHYLPFQGEPLVRFFSVSRIHGALVLIDILSRDNFRPTQFTAVHVSTKSDRNNPKPELAKKKLADLRWIAQWLEETQKLPGDVVAEESADLQAVIKLPFSQRLVHFATHGIFPNKDDQNAEINPYHSSGLVLAKDGHLPDNPKGQNGTLLTPQSLLEHKLDFWGSHITMQACVSGRAKEGIDGDALGLEWAFLLAKANSLLATHWTVDSGWTTSFSHRFYQKWLFDGDSRADAWRKTVLELMKTQEASDPYYWAAFSLSGDWR